MNIFSAIKIYTTQFLLYYTFYHMIWILIEFFHLYTGHNHRFAEYEEASIQYGARGLPPACRFGRT